MLGFLFKSVILHVVEKQTVVWYMLFLNSEVCKKYRFFWHNCCMFKGNYKNPKDAVFKKAFKSFIRSQYLKLKINMLLFESVFAKCIVSHAHTYMCVHTLSSHSLMSQHCSWFVLWSHVWPLPLWQWLKFIKCLWWLELSESNKSDWCIPWPHLLGGKIHLLKPFPNLRLSKLSKAYLENKSKRESEKWKNMYWILFFWRRECSFVGVYKLPVTWETPMWYVITLHLDN